MDSLDILRSIAISHSGDATNYYGSHEKEKQCSMSD